MKRMQASISSLRCTDASFVHVRCMALVAAVWLSALTRVLASLDDGFGGLHSMGACVVVLGNLVERTVLFKH